VPKATSTADAKDKNKQPDADSKDKGKEKEPNKEETGDADSKKNGHMDDVANQEEEKDIVVDLRDDMADTPKEEGNNEEVKKDEVKKEEPIQAPVQEYEEVKKQKKREIECLFSFTQQEGR